MKLKTILMALVVIYASATAGSAASITNDLVVHLAFDNSYQNSVTNAVKATAVGLPGFAPGKIGTHALTFKTASGRANYVTLGSPPELNFGGSTDFSVAFWVKFSLWDASQPFVSNKDWTSTFTAGWVVSTSLGGGFNWNFRESNGIEAHYFGPARTLSNGQWHHLGVTFDRDGNASAYLDGALVNQTPIGPGKPSVDTLAGLATNIGQDGTGAYPDATIDDGMIDDVGIWRRVVTAEEIKQIYEAGLKGQNLLNISAPPVVTEPPKITGISILKTDLTISWTNTVGAATLQRKKALTDASWLNVTTNSNQKATIPFDGQIAFFRIVVNP